MKYFLLLSLLWMTACSNEVNEQEKADRERAIVFTQKQKEIANTYSEKDPAVKLNLSETVDILKTLYPKMVVHSDPNKQEFKLTTSHVDKAVPFKDWESIKTFSSNESGKDVIYVLVEAYSEISAQESKRKTFEMCKNIWKNIDHRVPPIIDKLAQHLDENEARNLPLIVNELEYGYTFYANSKGYADGYAIGCGVTK